MKRFRITSHDKPHKLLLFNSAEALFAWTVKDGIDNSEVVELTLRPQDFLDVEMIGYEYANDGFRLRCFNLINAAYGRETENDSGHVVSKRLCWVSDAIFPMKEMSSGSLTIRKLSDDEGVKLKHPLEGDEEE